MDHVPRIYRPSQGAVRGRGAARGRLRAAGYVGLGAVLLVWPALLNGYPLVFSDTGAFLHQTLGPLMIWDKPWIYGPFLHLFHLRASLWPAAAAQGVMVSALLWLAVRRLAGSGREGVFLLAVAVVAALTAAPFTVAMLMPDLFTPGVVIGAFLLGAGGLSRGERWFVGAVLAVGVAAHLSHLPVVAALGGVVLVVLGWRAALRVAVPAAAGVALLLATNLAGHGRVALSPHGATFALARLVATGSAARTVAAECPGSGWYLCAFADRLGDYAEARCAPPDKPEVGCVRGTLASDHFLWNPTSPVNRNPDGSTRYLAGTLISAEAGEIVRRTVAREPVRVFLDAVADTLEQVVTFRVGDTLPRSAVGDGLRWRIAMGFPASEVARFEGGLQMRDRLAGVVAPLLWPQGIVALTGALALGWFAWRGRRDRVALAFAGCLFVGVLANAFATGALSGPHDRYGARVVWVVVFGAVVLGVRVGRR